MKFNTNKCEKRKSMKLLKDGNEGERTYLRKCLYDLPINQYDPKVYMLPRKGLFSVSRSRRAYRIINKIVYSKIR
ncbi:hypothetical protein RCL_jg4271.t1 [Rhizophagus clarus]|uniref:Uncharacterized protein n=1 Tax=Rhizophagus clarus TaxID=94130 RepID=A0A8H3KU48_9GLOM|nr:hypothetical protein RCL_jg4271.t1 [Rhizophagus clarus]